MQIESPTLKAIRERQKEFFKNRNATEREKMDWLILHLSLKVVELETIIQKKSKL